MDERSTTTVKLHTTDGTIFEASVDDIPNLRTSLLLDLLVSGTAGRAADGISVLAFPMVPLDIINAARTELARRIDEPPRAAHPDA